MGHNEINITLGNTADDWERDLQPSNDDRRGEVEGMDFVDASQ